jgi:hypothetical protein
MGSRKKQLEFLRGKNGAAFTPPFRIFCFADWRKPVQRWLGTGRPDVSGNDHCRDRYRAGEYLGVLARSLTARWLMMTRSR